MPATKHTDGVITLDGRSLTIDDVAAVATNGARVVLADGARPGIAASRAREAHIRFRAR